VTNEAKPNQTDGKSAPGKRSSKKILIPLIVLLLLAAGGGIGWRLLSQKAHADGPAPPPPLTIVHLENFIVNLADTDRDAYLKVGIDLGVRNTLKPDKDGKTNIPTPEIRDAILSVLTIYHSADLLTPEGKTKLKQNLVEVLDKKVPALGVREVYFSDFLVQR
jgi:flagellar FliL protein